MQEKCAICSKTIHNFYEDSESAIENPTDAIAFSGAGGFGSQFDYTEELFLLLCDRCVISLISTGKLYVFETVTPALQEVGEFKPVDPVRGPSPII